MTEQTIGLLILVKHGHDLARVTPQRQQFSSFCGSFSTSIANSCPLEASSQSSLTLSPTRSEPASETHQRHPVSGFSNKGATNACLYLEDLEVGDEWLSEPRRITADDVAEFAVLTEDVDPLHTNDGAGSPFGKPIAHGLLGLSILAGLSTRAPRVSTLALVSLEQWKFEAPVFFDDKVHVRTEVLTIEPHGRRAGRVTWHRQLINQHGKVVQHGNFISLVSSNKRFRRHADTSSDSTRPLPAR